MSLSVCEKCRFRYTVLSGPLQIDNDSVSSEPDKNAQADLGCPHVAGDTVPLGVAYIACFSVFYLIMRVHVYVFQKMLKIHLTLI